MSAPADTIWEAVKVVAFVACILGAAALLVWCSEVHAKPGPYMTVESHTDADYTHSVTTTNHCPHPVTVTREWVRHTLPDGRMCSRLRRLGVGTLLQPGEAWTVVVWRKQ